MTLYAARFAPESTSLEDAEILDRSRHGWDFLGQAIALWRLIDPARADAIVAIKKRASEAPGGHTQFAGEDLAALVQLIDSIDDAIVDGCGSLGTAPDEDELIVVFSFRRGASQKIRTHRIWTLAQMERCMQRAFSTVAQLALLWSCHPSEVSTPQPTRRILGKVHSAGGVAANDLLLIVTDLASSKEM